jgi:hypothetical protein
MQLAAAARLSQLRDMAIDRGILDQQLQKLGEPTRWWSQRELRDLPAVMQPDEQITFITRGRVARFRWLRRTWLIVATDRRLLCLRSAGSSWRQIEVGGHTITRVSLRVGPFKGRVRVFADGRTYRMLVPRADAYKLQSALLNLVNVGKPPAASLAPTRVVGRIVDHVLALPAVALDPSSVVSPQHVERARSEIAQREARIHELEQQLQQAQDQVEFLEQLIHDRSAKNMGGIPSKAPGVLPPGS